MIDSELQGNTDLFQSQAPTPDQQILTNSQIPRGCWNGILSSLQVSQSKMVELVEDRICESVTKKSKQETLPCESCQAWEEWFQQSQQKMLLIEKKLIQRQKALHERIKSLTCNLENQSKGYERLQGEYQKQKSKDKKLIEQLNMMIQQLKIVLKNNKINIKIQRKHISPNNFQIDNVVKEEEDEGYEDAFLIDKGEKQKQAIESSIIKQNKLSSNNSEGILCPVQVVKDCKQNYSEDMLSGPKNQFSNFSKKLNIQIVPNLQYHYQQNKLTMQSYENIQNLKTSKSEYLSTLSNHQKTTSIEHNEPQSTCKTIKLNNHYVNVEKSRFNNATSECGYGQDTGAKSSNCYYKEPYDERTTLISHSDGKNKLTRSKNPENMSLIGEGKKCPQQVIEKIHKLQFENENLKSYNRVLLQKLSNSRPRKY